MVPYKCRKFRNVFEFWNSNPTKSSSLSFLFSLFSSTEFVLFVTRFNYYINSAIIYFVISCILRRKRKLSRKNTQKRGVEVCRTVWKKKTRKWEEGDFPFRIVQTIVKRMNGGWWYRRVTTSLVTDNSFVGGTPTDKWIITIFELRLMVLFRKWWIRQITCYAFDMYIIIKRINLLQWK